MAAGRLSHVVPSSGGHPIASLNSARRLRDALQRAKWLYFTRFWGMDIHPSVGFSLSARLDKTNPRGIHIGEGTYLAFECAILSHDALHNRHVDTWIGRNCFVGARSIVLPGVRIGDHCVIGAGAVVTSDIPSNSIAVGNPAKVIKMNISLSKDHILVEPAR